MKRLKDWYEVEHDVGRTERRVTEAFEKWYKGKITITHGSGRNAEEIFGLPYTSTSDYAAIWNCQASAYLNEDEQWKFLGLAISEDRNILAIFDREDTGIFDDKEIVIGIV